MVDQIKLFGEDALLAYNTYKELKNTGSRLVNKYGKGVGAGVVRPFKNREYAK